MSTRVFVLVVSLLSALLAATVIGGYLIWNRSQEGAAAMIGGPFTLVDQSGQTVTEEALKGKWSLIYFGYTFCPDVCPTSLTVMTQALDQIGPLADQVTPVFITIDPERDTVQQLASYHDHFHPNFIMLTGTPTQVKDTAKAYRVYFRKAETEGSTDYLMDHSSITYLMDPEGQYVTHFSHDATADGMAQTIRAKLGG